MKKVRASERDARTFLLQKLDKPRDFSGLGWSNIKRTLLERVIFLSRKIHELPVQAEERRNCCESKIIRKTYLREVQSHQEKRKYPDYL